MAETKFSAISFMRGKRRDVLLPLISCEAHNGPGAKMSLDKRYLLLK